MVVVRLKGGLGNQLFQYYFGKYIEYNGAEVLYDIVEFSQKNLRKLEIQDLLLEQKIKSIFRFNDLFVFSNYSLINCKVFETFNESIKEEENYYFNGYFQELAFWQGFRTKVIGHFWAHFNKEDLTGYAGVHVRRGDYISAKNKDSHGFVGLHYYEKALRILPEDLRVVVFSDDIEWCRETDCFSSALFVENLFVEEITDFQEFLLLSSCSWIVTANSSYSWWAAYLSDAKVITPSCWFLNEHTESKRPNALREWIQI